MAKTWGEIRLEALHLGFDKPYNYEKQKDAFIKAFNWAQRHVAVVSSALIYRMTRIIDKDDEYTNFDMQDVAERSGREFLHMAQRGVTDGHENKWDNWRLVDNRWLLLKGRRLEACDAYYVYAPKPIDADTPDSYECELPDKWARIIPYYMANRLYLEDDTEKAGYYWNVAEDMTNHILLKEREPEVSVMGGIDIDGWCY